jgi:hypothetical protein
MRQNDRSTIILTTTVRNSADPRQHLQNDQNGLKEKTMNVEEILTCCSTGTREYDQVACTNECGCIQPCECGEACVCATAE